MAFLIVLGFHVIVVPIGISVTVIFISDDIVGIIILVIVTGVCLVM